MGSLLDNGIVQIILGIIVAAPGIIALILGRRKEKAVAKVTESDYADKISKIAMVLIEPLEVRIKKLEGEVSSMRTYISALLRGISKLIQQLRDNKLEPVWTPESMEFDDDKIE